MSENAYHNFHLAALRAHIRRVGLECVFRDQVFKAERVRLKPDDSRLIKHPHAVHVLIAVTDELPSPVPKHGDDILVAGAYYRVSGCPDSLLTGLSEFLLNPA